MRTTALLAAFLFAATMFVVAQAHPSVTMNLWPTPPAGGAAAPEADLTKPTDPMVAGRVLIHLGNVSNPTLTVYKPAKPNGAAVLVFPGGGYYILAYDLEGTEVCDWLTAKGVTCVLVKYRVPDSGPYPKKVTALQDAQRAISIVRSRAAEWGIDPKRIGVLGFSAGAHLAAALSNNYEKRLYDVIDAADQLSCRPDFAVIVYPGYTSDESAALNVTANTPPTILFQTEDDPVKVESSLVYYVALKKAKVPVEMHLYPTGGHGYGLRRTSTLVTTWPDRVDDWMRSQSITPGGSK